MGLLNFLTVFSLGLKFFGALNSLLSPFWSVLTTASKRQKYTISFSLSVFQKNFYVRFFISLTERARVYTISQNSSVFQFCGG